MKSHDQIFPHFSEKRTWSLILAITLFAYWLFNVFSYYDGENASFVIQTILLPALLCFVGLCLIQGTLWKKPLFISLAAFALWIIAIQFRNAIKFPDLFAENKGFSVNWLFSIIVYAVLCFPLASILPEAQRKKVLYGLGNAFLSCFSIICLAAIVVVVRGETLYNPSGFFFGIQQSDRRLYMFSNSNNCGMICMLALLVTICMLLSRKSWKGRVFYGILFLIFSTTLALTDSRANLIGSAVGIGCLAFLLVRHYASGKVKPLASWIAGILCAVAAVLLCFGLFRVETSFVDMVSDEQQVEKLAARSPVTEAISGRFGGRDMYWEGAVNIIQRDPSILLFGKPSDELRQLMVREIGVSSDYFHNLPLQVLMRYGIPGVLLLLAFLVLLAIRSIHVFLDTTPGTPLAVRFLPAILLACMLEETMESQLFLSIFTIQDPIFFIIAGIVVHASYAVKKPSTLSLSEKV